MGAICGCSKDDGTVLDSPNHNNKRQDQYRRIITFKDFKGLQKIEDITQYYTFGDTLGTGSFGTVKRARHIKANIDCAVKIIKKREIQKHDILV